MNINIIIKKCIYFIQNFKIIYYMFSIMTNILICTNYISTHGVVYLYNTNTYHHSMLWKWTRYITWYAFTSFLINLFICVCVVGMFETFWAQHKCVNLMTLFRTMQRMNAEVVYILRKIKWLRASKMDKIEKTKSVAQVALWLFRSRIDEAI